MVNLKTVRTARQPVVRKSCLTRKNRQILIVAISFPDKSQTGKGETGGQNESKDIVV